MNTKAKGLARIFIYPSGKNKYTAVCLDFNIIEQANSIQEAKRQVLEAVVGYVENICKNNLSNKLLNRNAPKRYWDLGREWVPSRR